MPTKGGATKLFSSSNVGIADLYLDNGLPVSALGDNSPPAEADGDANACVRSGDAIGTGGEPGCDVNTTSSVRLTHTESKITQSLTTLNLIFGAITTG